MHIEITPEELKAVYELFTNPSKPDAEPWTFTRSGDTIQRDALGILRGFEDTELHSNGRPYAPTISYIVGDAGEYRSPCGAGSPPIGHAIGDAQ